MVVVKIKENSKQAKAVVEMLKTFPFVEVVEEDILKTEDTTERQLSQIAKKINKSATQRMLRTHGLEIDT